MDQDGDIDIWNEERVSSRRFFIASTVAISAVPTLEAAAPLATRTSTYDFAAIAERLARPAKHRQVFAVARVANGSVTGYLSHSLDAYETAMAEGPGTLHVAAVFYGTGVVLGLGDEAWKKYRLFDHVHRRGDVVSKMVASGNPFSDEFAALGRRGATFLVCDNALADWATYLVTTGGFNEASIDAVRQDLRRNLLSGAQLVPAGVAALNETQEAKFTYVQASI